MRNVAKRPGMTEGNDNNQIGKKAVKERIRIRSGYPVFLPFPTVSLGALMCVFQFVARQPAKGVGCTWLKRYRAIVCLLSPIPNQEEKRGEEEVSSFHTALKKNKTSFFRMWPLPHRVYSTRRPQSSCHHPQRRRKSYKPSGSCMKRNVN